MNRIRRIHLLIVAVVLFVGIAIAFLMVLVKPLKNNIATLDGNIAQEQAVANRLPQALASLTEAQTKRAAAESKWRMVMQTKMSHISLGDPYRAIFAIYAD
jgi:F0F1-type ATP synthase membrane subunit b/b'